LSLPPLMKL